ncbi:MAG: glycosyltransferase family 9 protein [Deltaproteobacteria bacterium]|nr:glycosyltransferase family 9 protein [Deltaproteobacteria bacterium]
MNPFRVLIIQLARMGDIVQTLPLLIRLREEIPNIHITFLCIDRFSEILKVTPLINRYVKISTDKALKLLKLDNSNIEILLQHPFLKEAYDLLINLTHDFPSAIISDRIKALEKTGAIAEGDRLILKDRWTRYIFSCVENREENSFNLVDIHIGMGKVSHRPVVKYLFTEKRVEENIKGFIRSLVGSKKSPIIAFHMGANRFHRTWPIENFAYLAKELIKHYEARIVLTGSQQEEPLFYEFASKMPLDYIETNQVINLIGKTKLRDLIALLKCCNLLISNDTGPIHIAAAVGTPTVGIYLSTAYPSETAPYGEGHYVIHPSIACYPCLDEPLGFPCGLPCRQTVSPQDVFKLSSRIIENTEREEETNSVDSIVLSSRFLSNGTLFYKLLNVPSKIPSALVDKKLKQRLLRLLWEGVLEIPSDFSIIYDESPHNILSWLTKISVALEGLLLLIQEKKYVVDNPSLKGLSGLLVDFAKLSIYSGCPEEIPKTIFSMVRRLSEIQRWIKKPFPYA